MSQTQFSGAVELLEYLVQFLIYLKEIELGQFEVEHSISTILFYRIPKEGLAITKLLM